MFSGHYAVLRCFMLIFRVQFLNSRPPAYRGQCEKGAIFFSYYKHLNPFCIFNSFCYSVLITSIATYPQLSADGRVQFSSVSRGILFESRMSVANYEHRIKETQHLSRKNPKQDLVYWPYS